MLKVEELHILEKDRPEPVVLLIFAGSLAGTVALLFYLHVITLTLGSLTSEQIASNA